MSFTKTGDWQVFNRSGITHLVSISGSHITMIAALAGSPCIGWPGAALARQAVAERLPARLPAAWTALAWPGVIACWPVGVAGAAHLFDAGRGRYCIRAARAVTGTRIVCLAALFVVLLDPGLCWPAAFWCLRRGSGTADQHPMARDGHCLAPHRACCAGGGPW